MMRSSADAQVRSGLFRHQQGQDSGNRCTVLVIEVFADADQGKSVARGRLRKVENVVSIAIDYLRSLARLEAGLGATVLFERVQLAHVPPGLTDAGRLPEDGIQVLHVLEHQTEDDQVIAIIGKLPLP